jgi:tRNA pseudouridine38-40 synthase
MNRRKIRLIVQYDGGRYSGWQIQPGKRTIQGELSQAVSSLVGRKITVHGASRTDAGVSALGQSAVFEVISPIPTENFKDAINDRLPPNIVITHLEEADNDFDVMGGPKSKHYRYTIYTGRSRPVFHVNQCWHIPRKLDVPTMNAAAQLLVGTHDFKSFATAKDKRESTIRTIFRCTVTTAADPGVYALPIDSASPATRDTKYEIRNTKYVIIDVEGNAFLYNMVRNIVGTLVEVGRGRWQPPKITEILQARDRTAAGPIAPPQGLCLISVNYSAAAAPGD